MWETEYPGLAGALEALGVARLAAREANADDNYNDVLFATS